MTIGNNFLQIFHPVPHIQIIIVNEWCQSAVSIFDGITNALQNSRHYVTCVLIVTECRYFANYRWKMFFLLCIFSQLEKFPVNDPTKTHQIFQSMVVADYVMQNGSWIASFVTQNAMIWRFFPFAQNQFSDVLQSNQCLIFDTVQCWLNFCLLFNFILESRWYRLTRCNIHGNFSKKIMHFKDTFANTETPQMGLLTLWFAARNRRPESFRIDRRLQFHLMLTSSNVSLQASFTG